MRGFRVSYRVARARRSWIGRTVNRPTPFVVPGFALRTVLGEFADEGVLGGQRAIPAALENAGFRFHHNTIGEALRFATAGSRE